VEYVPRRYGQETWPRPRISEAVGLRPRRLLPLRSGASRTAPGPGASRTTFAGRSPAEERRAGDCRACASRRTAGMNGHAAHSGSIPGFSRCQSPHTVLPQGIAARSSLRSLGSSVGALYFWGRAFAERKPTPGGLRGSWSRRLHCMSFEATDGGLCRLITDRGLEKGTNRPRRPLLQWRSR
jgi:hypothetical protein